MIKVVYNNCYGGFSLSREAVLLGRKISGDPTWGGPCIKEDTRYDGTTVDWDYGYTEIPRHDPVLVQVVEELNPDASSGECAGLAIAEVSGPYRIDEYDGWESVQEPDDLNWIIP